MAILISFAAGFVAGMLSAYLHELYLADKHDQKVAEMYEDDDEIFIE